MGPTIGCHRSTDKFVIKMYKLIIGKPILYIMSIRKLSYGRLTLHNRSNRDRAYWGEANILYIIFSLGLFCIAVTLLPSPVWGRVGTQSFCYYYVYYTIMFINTTSHGSDTCTNCNFIRYTSNFFRSFLRGLVFS